MASSSKVRRRDASDGEPARAWGARARGGAPPRPRQPPQPIPPRLPPPPQFPAGLKVLLVDFPGTVAAHLQSPELSYSVTSVGSASEALALLSTGVAAFDVVLAEVRRAGAGAAARAVQQTGWPPHGGLRPPTCLHAAPSRPARPSPLPPQSKLVACDEPTGRSFVNAFEDTPVVLMTEAATQADVLAAVQLGAVDFLDKPLSLLKLKNIWQHSVRKVRTSRASTQLGAPRGGVTAISRPPAYGSQAPSVPRRRNARVSASLPTRPALAPSLPPPR